MVTISTLLRDRSTLDQLEILMRADRMFPLGRHYWGLLTPEEADRLSAGLRVAVEVRP